MFLVMNMGSLCEEPLAVEPLAAVGVAVGGLDWRCDWVR